MSSGSAMLWLGCPRSLITRAMLFLLLWSSIAGVLGGTDIMQGSSTSSSLQKSDASTESTSSAEDVDSSTKSPSSAENVDNSTKSPSSAEDVDNSTESPSSAEDVGNSTESSSSAEDVDNSTKSPSSAEDADASTKSPSSAEDSTYGNDNLPLSLQLDADGRYNISWTSTADYITIQLSVQTSGFVVFGFKPMPEVDISAVRPMNESGTSGPSAGLSGIGGIARPSGQQLMANADIVTYSSVDGNYLLQDRFGRSNGEPPGEPSVDGSQDWELIEKGNATGVIKIKMKRKLISLDAEDHNITTALFEVLWSFNTVSKTYIYGNSVNQGSVQNVSLLPIKYPQESLAPVNVTTEIMTTMMETTTPTSQPTTQTEPTTTTTTPPPPKPLHIRFRFKSTLESVVNTDQWKIHMGKWLASLGGLDAKYIHNIFISEDMNEVSYDILVDGDSDITSEEGAESTKNKVQAECCTVYLGPKNTTFNVEPSSWEKPGTFEEACGVKRCYNKGECKSEGMLKFTCSCDEYWVGPRCEKEKDLLVFIKFVLDADYSVVQENSTDIQIISHLASLGGVTVDRITKFYFQREAPGKTQLSYEILPDPKPVANKKTAFDAAQQTTSALETSGSLTITEDAVFRFAANSITWQKLVRPCEVDRCLNRGKCEPEDSKGWQCKCPRQWIGLLCQQERDLPFYVTFRLQANYSLVIAQGIEGWRVVLHPQLARFGRVKQERLSKVSIWQGSIAVGYEMGPATNDSTQSAAEAVADSLEFLNDPDTVIVGPDGDSFSIIPGSAQSAKLVDGCSTNRCHNDGVCVTDGFEDFTCACQEGYKGSLCEIETTPDNMTIVITVVAVAGALVLLVFIFIVCHYQRQKKKYSSPSDTETLMVPAYEPGFTGTLWHAPVWQSTARTKRRELKATANIPQLTPAGSVISETASDIRMDPLGQEFNEPSVSQTASLNNYYMDGNKDQGSKMENDWSNQQHVTVIEHHPDPQGMISSGDPPVEVNPFPYPAQGMPGSKVAVNNGHNYENQAFNVPPPPPLGINAVYSQVNKAPKISFRDRPSVIPNQGVDQLGPSSSELFYDGHIPSGHPEFTEMNTLPTILEGTQGGYM